LWSRCSVEACLEVDHHEALTFAVEPEVGRHARLADCRFDIRRSKVIEQFLALSVTEDARNKPIKVVGSLRDLARIGSFSRPKPLPAVSMDARR
jgi:hypothetical protein